MKGITVTLILVGLGLILSACAALVATPADNGEIKITLHDYYFSPDVIKIKAGQQVTFVFSNEGDKLHEFMAGRNIRLEGNFTEGFSEDFFAGITPEITGPGMVMGLAGGAEHDMEQMAPGEQTTGTAEPMGQMNEGEPTGDMEHDMSQMAPGEQMPATEEPMGQMNEGEPTGGREHDMSQMAPGEQMPATEEPMGGMEHDMSQMAPGEQMTGTTEPATAMPPGEQATMEHDMEQMAPGEQMPATEEPMGQMNEGGQMGGMEHDMESMATGSFGPLQRPAMDAHAGLMIMIDPAMIPSDQVTRITFTVPEDKVGTWEIGCFQEQGQHYDDGMRGTLIVEPAS